MAGRMRLTLGSVWAVYVECGVPVLGGGPRGGLWRWRKQMQWAACDAGYCHGSLSWSWACGSSDDPRTNGEEQMPSGL